MNTTFRQRCASALTHPATVGALTVLLVNDLVLKALWSNPWTTGKLSDLAWVVFASPLLAFTLSFPARNSRLAQRAAFVIAYIGLTALYAAFNTFEPLHELIIKGLLTLSGASVGSPFDPTDSLVIPFALGIALWVWKRPVAPSGSLRVRLAVLMAGVAAFATIATAAPHEPNRNIGHIDENTLILNLWTPHASTDGGFTWHAYSSSFDRAEVVWGSREAQTPRGVYTIDNLEIIRTVDSKKETAYSPSYLQDKGDVRFQDHLDNHSYTICPFSCPSSRPLNMVYDSRSDNIVVATGSWGVIVGDSDGNWKQVAVGGYAPTDFFLQQ